MQKKPEDLKFRIIELLDKQPAKWGIIMKKLTIKHPNTLAHWIHALISGGLIEKDKFRGEYSLTPLGMSWLQQERQKRRTDGQMPRFSQSFLKEEHNIATNQILMLSSVLDRQVPVSLTIQTDPWLEQHGVVDDLMKGRDQWDWNMFYWIHQKVAAAKGFKDIPDFLDTEKQMDYVRETYDFEITLTFNFNPHRALEGVDWEKARKVARQSEERMSEELRQYLESIQKKTPEQKREHIRGCIEFKAEEQKANLRHMLFLVGKDEKDLLQKIVEDIGRKPATPSEGNRMSHFYSKGEILDVLNEMIDHKEIEIMHFYTFKKRDKPKSLGKRIVEKLGV
jgi:Mn-dependent DtxR family transcriptional regulator